MPLPKDRSRSVRRVHKRTPTRKNVIHYKRRKKGNKHKCAITGVRLLGVSSKRKTAHTKKKPNRIFGGHLSAKLTSRIMRFRQRLKAKEIKLSDIPIILRKYV